MLRTFSPAPGRPVRRRGEKSVLSAIAVGTDPITFAMSSSKFAPMQGQDELGYAGCLRGRPVEVVKAEDSDFLVPAHAEMIIEGEIMLLDTWREAAPFIVFSGLAVVVLLWASVVRSRNPTIGTPNPKGSALSPPEPTG